MAAGNVHQHQEEETVMKRNDLKKEVIRARRRVAELQKSFCIGNRGGESYHIVLTDESGDTLSQEMRRTIRRQTSFEDKIKRRKPE